MRIPIYALYARLGRDPAGSKVTRDSPYLTVAIHGFFRNRRSCSLIGIKHEPEMPVRASAIYGMLIVGEIHWTCSTSGMDQRKLGNAPRRQGPIS